MEVVGRVLIIPKGEYSASETYEMLDLVNYNGTAWLAKKTSVGIEPSDANEEYWHKLISLEKTVDINVLLHNLIWTAKTEDMYVSNNINIEDAHTILSVSFMDCENLHSTDGVIPMISLGGKGIRILANTNSFTEDVTVSVRVTYR